MKFALRPWHVLPCGLILLGLAGISAAGFAPKPLIATGPLAVIRSLSVEGELAGSRSVIRTMPQSAVLHYEEPARPEDPAERTDELLNAILREASRKK